MYTNNLSFIIVNLLVLKNLIEKKERYIFENIEMLPTCTKYFAKVKLFLNVFKMCTLYIYVQRTYKGLKLYT